MKSWAESTGEGHAEAMVASPTRRGRPGVLSAVFVSVALAVGCDESSTRATDNNPPVIESITASPAQIPIGGVSTVTAKVTDPDGDKLTYRWQAGLGVLTGSGPTVQYTAESCCPGQNPIVLRASDQKGAETRGEIIIVVGP
jgi:hypothetical protein